MTRSYSLVPSATSPRDPIRLARTRRFQLPTGMAQPDNQERRGWGRPSCRPAAIPLPEQVISRYAGHGKGGGMEYGKAIVVGELASLDLEEPSPAAAAVYDQPIGLRLLYEDPGGEEHYLVRYPAGLKGRPHRHTAAHT